MNNITNNVSKNISQNITENATRDLNSNFSQIFTISSKTNSNSREEIELERNLSCLDEQALEIIKQTEHIITTQLSKMEKIVQNEIQKDRAMREKEKQSDITTDFLFAIAVILFVIAIVRGTSLSL